MAFDRERYRRDVLDPARTGDRLPPLLVRYALDADALRDPVRCAARIDEVAGYWRVLRQRRTYAKLVDGLLGAHTGLDRAGELDAASLVARGRREQQASSETLGRYAKDLAVRTAWVSPATVSALAERLGGAVGADAVAAALGEHRVGVADPPALPSGPPTPQYRRLRSHKNALGCRLSAELVFGEEVRRGFRLLRGFQLDAGGRRLDVASINAAMEQLARATHDERKTAAADGLAILRAVAKAGAVDTLLRWEVVEALRPLAESGLSPRAVAAEAVELGLVADEAALVAFALDEGRDGGGADPVLSEVRAALSSGRLRAAVRAAASLSGDDEDTTSVRALLEQAEARVARLSEEAERARRAGRSEDAARLLTHALVVAADDDDLQHRLATLPPPPPAGARAEVDGLRVLVAWRASEVQVGRLRYQVVRGSGRHPSVVGQGLVLGETEQLELVDPHPPVGETLRYSVFAARDRRAWSPAADAPPVVVTPEVTDLTCEADAGAVTASWRAHPRAAAAVVVRRPHRPPSSLSDGQVVAAANLVGFADRDVQTGTPYHYRVAARYVDRDGRSHTSSGVLVRAVPEPVPVEVVDLEAVVRVRAGDPVVECAWTQPAHGTVALRLSTTAPPWTVGALVPLAELSELGRPLHATDQDQQGRRVRMTASLPHGRWHLSAFTLGSGRAAVGTTVALSVVEPVRDVATERLGPVVRLSWVWPERSTAAQLRWWDSAAASPAVQETTCSKRAYLDDGGVELRVGAGPVAVEVRAVTSHPGGEMTAPGVLVDVDAVPSEVRYTVKRTGLRRRRVRVRLVASEPCRLPAIVVVHRPGHVRPLGPHQGTVLARIPPQDVAPTVPVTVEIDLPGGRGPGWVACFPERADGHAIVLVPPPPAALALGPRTRT